MKTVLSVLSRAVPVALIGLLAGACNNVQSTSEPSAVVLDEDGAYSANGKPLNPASVSFRTKCTGLTCTFTDASNCKDSVREWSFGDGGLASGTPGGKVSHTYLAAGSYVVTLATPTCGPASKLIVVD